MVTKVAHSSFISIKTNKKYGHFAFGSKSMSNCTYTVKICYNILLYQSLYIETCI